MTTTRWLVYAVRNGAIDPMPTLHSTQAEAEQQARAWLGRLRGFTLFTVAVVIDDQHGKQVGPDAEGFELEG
jgi:dihydroorotase-like cyclic amidohydrolase